MLSHPGKKKGNWKFQIFLRFAFPKQKRKKNMNKSKKEQDKKGFAKNSPIWKKKVLVLF